MTSSITLSRARALKIAAVLSFVLGLESFIVAIPELMRGVNEVSTSSDGPPYFVMLIALVLGIVRMIGSIGTWQGQRTGIILTVVANMLDMMAAAPGILVGPSPLWQMAALTGVCVSAAVIVLCFWRDGTPAQ